MNMFNWMDLKIQQDSIIMLEVLYIDLIDWGPVWGHTYIKFPTLFDNNIAS